MKLRLDIEQAIYNWLKDLTNLEVIAEQEKYRSPEILGDFVSYNIGDIIKNGSDSLVYKAGNVYEIKGIRKVNVEVRVYSQTAMNIALMLQQSLYSPVVLESYFYNYGFLNDEQVQNITIALDTGFEIRSLLTFSLLFGTNFESGVGYIEEVEINSEINEIENQTIIGGE